MDAPVVVKPDMVSKNASVMEGIAPVKIKGNAPNIENIIQPALTIIYPSFLPSDLSEFLNINHKIKPETIVTRHEIKIKF